MFIGNWKFLVIFIIKKGLANNRLQNDDNVFVAKIGEHPKQERDSRDQVSCADHLVTNSRDRQKRTKQNRQKPTSHCNVNYRSHD